MVSDGRRSRDTEPREAARRILAKAVLQSVSMEASATKRCGKRKWGALLEVRCAAYLRPSWAISIVSMEISFLLAS